MRLISLIVGLVYLLAFVVVPGSLPAMSITVTNAEDSGPGSLRQAIEDANRNPGSDLIEFNIPPAGLVHTIQPSSILPPITDPVIIDGYTQTGASPNTNPVGQGLNTVLKIVLNGSSAGDAMGLEIVAGNSTVRGLVIKDFSAEGIWIHTGGGNVIEGNFIGTDFSGISASGNGMEGVSIWSSNNTVGGTTPAARNLLSGNAQMGVLMIGAGVTGNVVQGNLIGTDISGTADRGNALFGISIFGGANNTIGGTNPGAHNVISGNDAIGVLIIESTASNNVVQGNFIGTDVTGTSPIGNSNAGVVIQQQASNNTIGGTSMESTNVISGNGFAGVYLANSGTTDNLVLGNFIGVDSYGTGALGNGGDGVRIDDEASDNSIGGTAGNTIAFNVLAGVVSSSGTGNAILSNTVFSNGGLGIDLNDDGVTPNDAGDGDAGANHVQNFPVLTSATPDLVQGNLNSTPNTEFRIDFFSNTECDPSGYGEGETFLEGIIVYTDTGGDASFSFTPSDAIAEGQFITATATDPSGNTSEFSQCIEIQVPCFLEVSSPNGGEIWEAGETEIITWISENTSGTVIIEYSPDGGEFYIPISGGTEDDGSYDWTVPGTPSDNCLVIICDALDSTCCDQNDEFFVIHAECDFAVTHIAVSNPVSVNYTTPVQVAITNLSNLDMAPGNAYIDILDEGGVSILPGDVHPIGPKFQYPFFLLPAGDTIYAYEYDWRPAAGGLYYLKVLLESPCDTLGVNDTMLIGPVAVSESGSGYLGYFDPYSTERDSVESEPGAGPAVRFSIPGETPEAALQTLVIGAAWNGSVSSSSCPDRGRDRGMSDEVSPLEVYVFGPGENDSTFGDELIAPFLFYPDSVDADGRIVLDLTQRPDYESLVGLCGDFWIHLRATDETAVRFFAKPLLPDGAFHRNWMYYAEGGSRSRGGAIEGRAGEPEIVRVTKGWEENIGITFSPSWLEGVRGDVNNDGSINILDVLATINHILGTVPLSGDG
ncbi:MAG: hypothetical protein JSV84_07495, partial [Gemmatimonadota bacterium]